MIDATRPPGLRIGQIYLLDVQFSHREDVWTLPQQTTIPDFTVGVEVQLLGAPDQSIGGMIIRVSTDPSENPIYRFVVTMAMVVQAEEGKENLSPLDFAASAGVSALFPFVRETVANLTGRGRFGPIWLKPINVRMDLEPAAREQIPEEKPRPKRSAKPQKR